MLNRHVDTRKKTISPRTQTKRYISPDGIAHNALPALWEGKGGLTDENCEKHGWKIKSIPTAPAIVMPVADNPRRAVVLNALQAVLSTYDWQPLHVIAEVENQPAIADTALILCHYGQNKERIDANKRALEWTLQSDPKPAKIIFVEAAEDKEQYRFEYLADVGVTYIKKKVPTTGVGLWLKEPLWDIGAIEALKDSAITKLVFLDADCSFADQSWASQVSTTLDSYDIISPHSCAYYAENTTDMSYGLMPTVGYQISQAKGKDSAPYGHPGMALAMTRVFYTQLGSLPYVSVGSGDTYTWYLVAGKKLFPAKAQQIPYKPTILERIGMRPIPRIGCAGQIIAHHDHGSINATRIYLERWVAFNASIHRPGVEYTIDKDGMPVWLDTPATRVLKTTMDEIKATRRDKTDGVWFRQLARDIYDKNALTEYGQIDDEHPLVVATLLRSGGQYDERHVIWLRDQFAAKCKTPHRFVCLSDKTIEGIETIPLQLTSKQSPGWWGQLEYFRKGIFSANASVLCCDLDTVLYREFTLHRCPVGQLCMSREINNWSKSTWAVWNAGLMYFRGDYSFIYDEYVSDLGAGILSHPEYHYPGCQEYMVTLLRKYGEVPYDVAAHLCYGFFEGDPNGVPSETQIVCFPSTPKPWDIKPKPWFIPAMPSPKRD